MEILSLRYGVSVKKKSFQKLKFFLKVGLKNVKSNKYLYYDDQKNLFNANGVHPFLKNNNNNSKPTASHQEFTILLHDKQEYTGPIIFGSSIFLQMK